MLMMGGVCGVCGKEERSAAAAIRKKCDRRFRNEQTAQLTEQFAQFCRRAVSDVVKIAPGEPSFF